MKANAVFEGGGMRGIGIVGALKCMETQGYTWDNVAGTSVGSVIAACIAAGYTAKEIGKLMTSTDFTKFQDKNFVQRFPVIGKAFGLFKEKGIYSGDYIEEWMNNALSAKGVVKFKDISIDGESKLKIVASDITNRTMMVLPDDLSKYGIDPMEFK
jgi:NTE family protein